MFNFVYGIKKMSLLVFNQWLKRGVGIKQVLPNGRLQQESLAFNSARQLRRWLWKKLSGWQRNFWKCSLIRLFSNSARDALVLQPCRLETLHAICVYCQKAILSWQHQVWGEHWAHLKMEIYDRPTNQQTIKKQLDGTRFLIILLCPGRTQKNKNV